MRSKKRADEEKVLSSYSINQRYEQEPQYPYLLACSLHRSTDQFEQTRSMKMLGEWVDEYMKLSQLLKFKYAGYLPKIQKILLGKYQLKAPIEYCLSRFLINFFHNWEDLTCAIVSDVSRSDRYALDFVWYICHSLVEGANLDKQPAVLDYLTTNFEEPLRHYEVMQSVEARKLTEIVFLMNIHGCQEPFRKHSLSWRNKFRMFLESSSGDSQLTLLMEVLKNKNLLQSRQESFEFWSQQANAFLVQLEGRIGGMRVENAVDRQFLELLTWLLEFREFRAILLAEETRFLRSLLSCMRPKEDNLEHVFHLKKYQEISMSALSQDRLCTFFSLRQTYKQHKSGFWTSSISSRATPTSSSTRRRTTFSWTASARGKSNLRRASSTTSSRYFLHHKGISDKTKVLSNNHIRRTLPVKVLMVLAKTITASLASCELSDEVVGHCLKAFTESVFNKANDPLIADLRSTIGRLFLGIMRRYSWQDGFKNDAVYGLCEESERNAFFVSDMVFEMLYLLIKKFGFNNETKLEPLLSDIFYKVLIVEEQLHSIISLLVTVVHHMKFPKAILFIEEICAKNPSQHAAFYLFQALALVRENFPNTTDFATISQTIATSNLWDGSRTDINLMMLEIFFMKTSQAEGLQMLRQLDGSLLQMFQLNYDQGNYRLLTLIAGKTLPAAGGNPEQMESLASYRWIRKMSFEMLARSFYKSTSINVCYIFSNIVLRSECPAVTLRWLAKDKFLDYLYQGLNDFISKEKQFTLETVTTVLVYKLLRNEPGLIPPGSRLQEFSTLVKNVSWWDEADNPLSFVPFSATSLNTSWILPQFRVYYEETMQDYFKEYLRRHSDKIHKAAEMEHLAHEEDI